MGSAQYTNPQVKAEATEWQWLVWFCQNADFGPADGDVRKALREKFEKETGKLIPKEWRGE